MRSEMVSRPGFTDHCKDAEKPFPTTILPENGMLFPHEETGLEDRVSS